MVGDRYWFTGVMLTPCGGDEWSIHLDYLDAGFCDSHSTEGTLRVRYMVKTESLSEHIDILLQDAARLGIAPHSGFSPSIYVAGDGEDSRIEYPANWREVARQQADRLGWSSYRLLERVPAAESGPSDSTAMRKEVASSLGPLALSSLAAAIAEFFVTPAMDLDNDEFHTQTPATPACISMHDRGPLSRVARARATGSRDCRLPITRATIAGPMPLLAKARTFLADHWVGMIVGLLLAVAALAFFSLLGMENVRGW